MNQKIFKFLIIDDDVELCEGFLEIFRDEGYAVDTTNDGHTGLDLIKTNCYDIVLLDIKMPGLNGVEVLHQLKARPLKSKIFIISGDPDISARLQNENIKSVVSGIIRKPFDINEMLEQVRLALAV